MTNKVELNKALQIAVAENNQAEVVKLLEAGADAQAGLDLVLGASPAIKALLEAAIKVEDKAPESTGEDKAPESTGEDKAPESTGEDKAPESTGEDKASESTDEVKVPESTDKVNTQDHTGDINPNPLIQNTSETLPTDTDL